MPEPPDKLKPADPADLADALAFARVRFKPMQDRFGLD